MEKIIKYFPGLTAWQIEQFSRLGSLYTSWNQKINVISRKDIDNLYVHHVLHSIAIAKVVSFREGTVVIDAGTGGGFPGIPLAILFPETRFLLADSIKKKITVVAAITTEIGLTNCETRNLRLEELKDKADFVVCRAVAEIPLLFKWIRKNIKPGGNNTLKNGLLALKGGDLENELLPFRNNAVVYNLTDFFSEVFFETKKLVYIPQI